MATLWRPSRFASDIQENGQLNWSAGKQGTVCWKRNYVRINDCGRCDDPPLSRIFPIPYVVPSLHFTRTHLLPRVTSLHVQVTPLSGRHPPRPLPKQYGTAPNLLNHNDMWSQKPCCPTIHRRTARDPSPNQKPSGRKSKRAPLHVTSVPAGPAPTSLPLPVRSPPTDGHDPAPTAPRISPLL